MCKLKECSDPAKKANCQRRIQAGATRTGIVAANKGDCAKANQIVALLKGGGITSAPLNTAAAKCK